MTQVHFTLNNEEVQSIIEHSVKGSVAKFPDKLILR